MGNGPGRVRPAPHRRQGLGGSQAAAGRTERGARRPPRRERAQAPPHAGSSGAFGNPGWDPASPGDHGPWPMDVTGGESTAASPGMGRPGATRVLLVTPGTPRGRPRDSQPREGARGSQGSGQELPGAFSAAARAWAGGGGQSEPSAPSQCPARAQELEGEQPLSRPLRPLRPRCQWLRRGLPGHAPGEGATLCSALVGPRG